jgi:uncharacterized protein
MFATGAAPLNIAVIGSGIAGLSAAWLLGQRHAVTVYEKDQRIGGHSNSVPIPGSPDGNSVDTGFIVYNEPSYPNLSALFEYLGVATQPAEMSLAVSLRGGTLEYSGKNLSAVFAQPRNVTSRRFWSMLRDLYRFYRDAPEDLAALEGQPITLGQYLDSHDYGVSFREDHLLPMAGAIWSAPPRAILDYPAASFIRFQDNHGLLRFTRRPIWRTVTGGSKNYVRLLTENFHNRIRLGATVKDVTGGSREAYIRDSHGTSTHYDHVVIATHADQALKLIASPRLEEQTLLKAFRYSRNRAILHSDSKLMPKRRAVWSSWNYIGQASDSASPTVTYWMNSLQSLWTEQPLFLTLNPLEEPSDVLHVAEYDHPLFDSAAIAAQKKLWSLQGRRRLWFCGSYFGYGFHEDALQAGLAVAEKIDPRCRRPWSVDNESGRIFLGAAGEFAARGIAA